MVPRILNLLVPYCIMAAFASLYLDHDVSFSKMMSDVGCRCGRCCGAPLIAEAYRYCPCLSLKHCLYTMLSRSSIPGEQQINRIQRVHKLAFIQALMDRGHMTETLAKDFLARISGLQTGRIDLNRFNLIQIGLTRAALQMQSTPRCLPR